MTLRILGQSLALALGLSLCAGSQAGTTTKSSLPMPFNGASLGFVKMINQNYECGVSARPSNFYRLHDIGMTDDAVISMDAGLFFTNPGPPANTYSIWYYGTAHLAFDDVTSGRSKTGTVTFDGASAGNDAGEFDPPKSLPFKAYSQTFSADGGTLAVSFVITFSGIPGIPGSCSATFKGVYRTQVSSHTGP